MAGCIGLPSTYVPERDLYICPEGKELRRIGEARKRQQTVYKVAAGTCRDCPLKAKCCPGPSDRVVTRRWDMLVVDEMQLRAQTRRGRRLLNRRQHVSEHINADDKEKHGMHRAQFRGRGKMQIQALLTAATMNLKRLMTRRPEAQSGMASWRPPTGRLVPFRAVRWPRSRRLSAKWWSRPIAASHCAGIGPRRPR